MKIRIVRSALYVVVGCSLIALPSKGQSAANINIGGANGTTLPNYSGELGYGDTVSTGSGGSFALGEGVTIGTSSTPATCSIALGQSSVYASFSLAEGYLSSVPSTGTDAIALGTSSMASGAYSVAIGTDASSAGGAAVSLGYFTMASGSGSLSTGSSTLASGNASASFNSATSAVGSDSSAFGKQTVANAFADVVIGQFNIGAVSTANSGATTWYTADPVLEIGNGTSTSNLSNAMTVYKNGNVNIQGVAAVHGVVRCAGGGDISMGSFTMGTAP